jgi:hypothetical protein
MDYVTQYYKNLSEQLQQRVNILTREVKYLTESGPVITDGNQGSGNTTVSPFGPGGYFYPFSPFGPGGYFYPPQLNPPTQSPRPLLPGDYSPAPPEPLGEWDRANPFPDFNDRKKYPWGKKDPRWQHDLDQYNRNNRDYTKRWREWLKEREVEGADPHQLPLPTPYHIYP